MYHRVSWAYHVGLSIFSIFWEWGPQIQIPLCQLQEDNRVGPREQAQVSCCRRYGVCHSVFQTMSPGVLRPLDQRAEGILPLKSFKLLPLYSWSTGTERECSGAALNDAGMKKAWAFKGYEKRTYATSLLSCIKDTLVTAKFVTLGNNHGHFDELLAYNSMISREQTLSWQTLIVRNHIFFNIR